jgi:hypothetical protein
MTKPSIFKKTLSSVPSAVKSMKNMRAERTPVGRNWKAASRVCVKATPSFVWRLDRLGRNLADLVKLIANLEQRKINFESLPEKIKTNSPAGRLVLHVFAALSEFERNLIRERTVAG